MPEGGDQRCARGRAPG